MSEGSKMITTLTGSNGYELRERLSEISSDFVKKYGELAIQKFDGEEDDTKSIIEGLQTSLWRGRNW